MHSSAILQMISLFNLKQRNNLPTREFGQHFVPKYPVLTISDTGLTSMIKRNNFFSSFLSRPTVLISKFKKNQSKSNHKTSYIMFKPTRRAWQKVTKKILSRLPLSIRMLFWYLSLSRVNSELNMAPCQQEAQKRQTGITDHQW